MVEGGRTGKTYGDSTRREELHTDLRVRPVSVIGVRADAWLFESTTFFF